VIAFHPQYAYNLGKKFCRTAAAGRGVVILKKKWLAAVLAGALLAAALLSGCSSVRSIGK